MTGVRHFWRPRAGWSKPRAAEQSAEIDLEYTKIRAPMSGRIDQALVDPGNLVSADQMVLTTIVASDPAHF